MCFFFAGRTSLCRSGCPFWEPGGFRMPSGPWGGVRQLVFLLETYTVRFVLWCDHVAGVTFPVFCVDGLCVFFRWSYIALSFRMTFLGAWRLQNAFGNLGWRPSARVLFGNMCSSGFFGILHHAMSCYSMLTNLASRSLAGVPKLPQFTVCGSYPAWSFVATLIEALEKQSCVTAVLEGPSCLTEVMEKDISSRRSVGRAVLSDRSVGTVVLSNRRVGRKILPNRSFGRAVLFNARFGKLNMGSKACALSSKA